MKTNTKNISCPFSIYCHFSSNGCDASCVSWCPDAEKIKNALGIPCPVMVSLGYNPENDPRGICKCNIPQIRSVIPAGTPCNPNGKCISEFFDKETREKVFSHSKGSFITLGKETIFAIISNIKKISIQN